MKICVFGLWHLGCVTAACLSDKGFDVVGLDPDKNVVDNLNKGIPPISEPGLEELIEKNLDENLHFTTDIQSALKDADVVWITFDTPVDDNDNADEIYVKQQIMSLFPYLQSGMTVLISSQLSVGSTRKIEEEYKKLFKNPNVYFVYSPENLRLGKAIEIFNNPERIIIGYNKYPGNNIFEILYNFSSYIISMSPESAEMTKHALNSFLATEIAFINEIATICEKTGADIRDVERGLKSDSRIGEKAYLKAGSAFAGGTLARDLRFLYSIKITPQISATLESNDHHKFWALHILHEHFDFDFIGKSVAVLGLTYKPDTNTLRRSSSVELCKKLVEFGANIKTHDPLIRELPKEYSNFNLCLTIREAICGVDAIVIATEWDNYKCLSKLANSHINVVVIDANNFLKDSLMKSINIKYYSVGKGV